MAELEAALAGVDDDEEGLWPDNEPIVDAFLAVQTQWRVASLSGGFAPGRLHYIGLDYSGALAALQAAGIAVTTDLWAGVQIMEAAAREALNEG